MFDAIGYFQMPWASLYCLCVISIVGAISIAARPFGKTAFFLGAITFDTDVIESSALVFFCSRDIGVYSTIAKN